MYRTFITLLSMIYALDIFDFIFMQWLDTTLPINTWAWLVIWFTVLFAGAATSDSQRRN